MFVFGVLRLVSFSRDIRRALGYGCRAVRMEGRKRKHVEDVGEKRARGSLGLLVVISNFEQLRYALRQESVPGRLRVPASPPPTTQGISR